MKDISKGYIALYRQFIDWEWFTDVNTCHLFQYCLLRANYKDTYWRGIEIKKGQFITSYEKLSIDTGLTIKQVRTALNKLKMTGEVAHETTNRNSIITVNNWNFYQDEGKQRANETTDKRQTEGKQRATDNKDNKENNISNTSYINSSSSSSSSIEEKKLPEISEEEEELLRNHSLKNKVRYFKPWLRKVLSNGDYKGILEQEHKRIARLEEKKKQQGEERKEELTPQEEEKEQEEIKRIQEEFKKKHHLS